MTASPYAADGIAQSSKSFEYGTPDEVLDAVRKVEGIGLDPCTTDDNPTAALDYYTEADDGLSQPWTTASGIVFVNPPYGRQHTGKWARKIRDESCAGAECIALLPSRTGARWFHDVMFASTALCFVNHRLRFKGASDPAPFDSVLFYTGTKTWCFIDAMKPLGLVINRGGGWYGG